MFPVEVVKELSLPSNSIEDLFISLSFEGLSNSIRNFVEALEKKLFLKTERARIINASFRKAIEAFTYDLLRIRSLGEENLGYVSRRPESFIGKRVGYKPFTRCFDFFLEEGLIAVRKGYFDRSIGVGEATRVRPTQDFLDLVESYGINLINFRSHFRFADSVPIVVLDPVRVRGSKRGDWSNPHRGPLLSIDKDNPKVAELTQRVQRFNGFLAGKRIEHPTIPEPMHAGFYRSYSWGDVFGFDYQWGGRLYNLGSYQRIEREERTAIMINGESVVEVDIACSHLTILHSMMGVPLHPSADPYTVAGIDRRSVVKRFVTMTLGNGNFQRAWPKKVCEAYLEDDLKLEKTTTIKYQPTKAGWKAREVKHYTAEELTYLQRDYPLAFVRQAVLKHLPVLAAYPGSGITWADLQYRESLGLIAAVEELAYKYGVPALPLHDSVIVPASKQELAARVMREAFRDYAGVSIKVTVK